VNTVGLRRRGFTDLQITQIEDIYRVIYVQNTNVSAALKIVEYELPASQEKEEIVEFIKSSTKGIMRGIS
jgi:UDP-N-acetylglucosamine acyltransferase